MKKFYILDRNAVSVIKDSVARKKVSSDKLARLTNLRKIDKKGNIISVIFSIIEGQSGKKETKDQMLLTLEKETKAISEFYHHAHTDSKILKQSKDKFIEIHSGEIEEGYGLYEEIIKKVREKPFHSIKAKDRKDILKDLISFVKERGISASHPVVICCLSGICGNPNARKIIKNKETDTYNAMNDLMTLPKVCFFIPILNPNNYPVKFLTFDNYLDSFFNSFFSSIKDISIVNGYMQVSHSTFDKNIFPNLTDEEYKELLNLIGE